MSYCATVIIGFRCSDDIVNCIGFLSASRNPKQVVHICENGGEESYRELIGAIGAHGTEEANLVPFRSVSTIVESRCFRIKEGDLLVYVHRASGNIGYAGGINAVLRFLAADPEWDAVWVLNPDTEPAPDALAALKDRAASGNYGIVGSRIVLQHNQRIQMYGGRWRRWMARGFNIGLGEPAAAQPDVAMVEAEMEYVCGASMYVVRPFIDQVGLMDERYFLYAEEVDWCFRRGAFKLGYAHDSIVQHSHGATIGSSHSRKARSGFSVFLDERSKLLFTRRFYPGILPLVAVATLILTTQYAVHGATKNFGVALRGWFSGLRGETGFPRQFLPKEDNAS